MGSTTKGKGTAKDKGKGKGKRKGRGPGRGATRERSDVGDVGHAAKRHRSQSSDGGKFENGAVGQDGGGVQATKRQRDRVLHLNRAIAACAQRKQPARARKIYEDMVSEGLTPTAPTFGALVNSAVRVGDLIQARSWMDESVRLGVQPGVVTYTTLLKGLCEAGLLHEATRVVFGPMAAAGCSPNLRTANTLLRGCKRAADVGLALRLYRKIRLPAVAAVSNDEGCSNGSVGCGEDGRGRGANDSGWGLRPDATTYEYLVSTLCQGLRTVAVRRLLRRLGKFVVEGNASATKEHEDGAEAARPLDKQTLARLWELTAEASLIRGEPLSRTRGALRCAARLRASLPVPLKTARSCDGDDDSTVATEAAGTFAGRAGMEAAPTQEEEKSEDVQATSIGASAAFFTEFKDSELKERAALVAATVEAAKTPNFELGEPLLTRLSRIIVLPASEQESGAADDCTGGNNRVFSSSAIAVEAHDNEHPACKANGGGVEFSPLRVDGLMRELRRSFGLVPLLRMQPRLPSSSDRRGSLATHLTRALHSGGKKKNVQELLLGNLFEDPSLPLKVELCSGDGHWVCSQAMADRGRANWCCMELRRDRVFRTLARSTLLRVPGLCLVSGDAAQGLRRLKARSVARVFVNFPEPPVRRGRGEGDGGAPHLLTASTLRLIRRALKPEGTLLVLSDNVTYLRQLATLVGEAGGFHAASPGDGCTPVRAEEQRPSNGSGKMGASVGTAPGGSLVATHAPLIVWCGRPHAECCGAPDPSASSYFDRLWKRGRFVKRFFLFARRAKHV